MRVGQGYDIHQVDPSRKLYLGGIEIACPVGLRGHSDADVLLHAVCDGLLGAAGLGDIGQHFPDTDPAYAGANSAMFLRNIAQMVREKNLRIINIDCTIFAEVVAINPIRAQIRNSISALLELAPEQVNIKAKTMEQMDAVGQKKAIAATSIVLLDEIS